MRWLMGLILTVIPSMSMALSCLPYSALHAYHDAAASEDAYVVVSGTLTFDEGLLPQVDWDRQQDVPPLTVIPARIKGKSLGRQGFEADFDRPVSLHVACYGPWCAGAASGAPYLAYLKRSGAGYVLETNPCGGFAFAEPGKATLRKVRRCFAGGFCPKP